MRSLSFDEDDCYHFHTTQKSSTQVGDNSMNANLLVLKVVRMVGNFNRRTVLIEI